MSIFGLVLRGIAPHSGAGLALRTEWSSCAARVLALLGMLAAPLYAAGLVEGFNFADREAETFLGRGWWRQFTRDGVRYLRSSHVVTSAGAHTLKIRMVDPGIVLEKLIIRDRPVPESYFGPLECPLVP